jgi:hypothetical protein
MFGWVSDFLKPRLKSVLGWRDATTDTVRQLADKFMKRFPESLRDCEGQDGGYWLVFQQRLRRLGG